MARAHRRLRNFRHLTEFGTVRSSQCHLTHDCALWHFVQQETAMPVAAGPTGHGTRRELQQTVYTNISIAVCMARLWLTLTRTGQRW
jgi:hypothetical protein